MSNLMILKQIKIIKNNKKFDYYYNKRNIPFKIVYLTKIFLHYKTEKLTKNEMCMSRKNKINIKDKITNLKKINYALNNKIKEQEEKLENLTKDKIRNEKLRKEIIYDLLVLQEINVLGTEEKEKNKSRNIIINKLINILQNSKNNI